MVDHDRHHPTWRALGPTSSRSLSPYLSRPPSPYQPLVGFINVHRKVTADHAPSKHTFTTPLRSLVACKLLPCRMVTTQVPAAHAIVHFLYKDCLPPGASQALMVHTLQLAERYGVSE